MNQKKTLGLPIDNEAAQDRLTALKKKLRYPICLDGGFHLGSFADCFIPLH